MKWLRSAVLLTVLAPLVGCSLYFNDQGSGDDSRCTSTPPTGEAADTMRNPETGACQSFPINEDPCGVAEPVAAGVLIPDWPACSGSCEGLDQTTCSTTIGCHGYFSDDNCAGAGCPGGSNFIACGEEGSPAPAAGTDCTTLDAESCANSDWCESVYSAATIGVVGANAFAYCAPISQPPDGACTTDLDCAVGYACVAVPTSENCTEGGCPPLPQLFECEPITPPPATCYTDADCASGSQCEFTNLDCAENGMGAPPECPGQCVVTTPPPVTCYSNADCSSGSQCEFTNLDCDTETGVPCPGECVVVTPPPVTCESDGDCAPGSECEFNDLGCGDPGSGASPPACMGQCVVVVTPPPSSCVDDSECGAGYVCQLEPRNPPLPCNTVECGEIGTCVLAPPQPSQCYEDSDCPTGDSCQLEPRVPQLACGSIECSVVGTCVVTPPPSCASLPDQASCQARSDCTAIFGGQGCTCDPASEVCNCPVITYQSCQAATQPSCESLTTEAACTARPDCQATYGGNNGCPVDPDGTVQCGQPQFTGCFTPERV